jgi:hypothetical protein
VKKAALWGGFSFERERGFQEILRKLLAAD